MSTKQPKQVSQSRSIGLGPLFLKPPLDDIELESMRVVDLKMFLGCVVSKELSLWVRDFNLCGERGVEKN